MSEAETTDRKPCPYCGESIAISAIKCRFCNEFLTDPNPASPRSVQTIEQTGKPWKAIQAISIVGFLVCGIGLLLSLGMNSPGGMIIFFMGGVVAMMTHMASRLGAWWFHG